VTAGPVAAAPAVLIYAGGLAAAMSLGKVGPVAPLLRPDLGLSLTALGWVISAITLVPTLIGVWAGLATRIVGPAAIFVAGLVLLSLAGAATALADGATGLLAMRLAEGLGYAAVVATGPGLLHAVTAPRYRATALALWGSFVPAGLALGASLGGQVGPAVGWRGWFLVCAAAALAVAVALAAALRFAETRTATGTVAAPPYGTAARVGGLGAVILIAAAFGLIALVGVAVVALLPAFLTEARGVAIGAAGNATGLVALSSVAGSFLAAAAAGRVHAPAYWAAALALMPAGAAIAFAGPVGSGTATLGAALILVANGYLVSLVFMRLPDLCDGPARLHLGNALVAQCGSLGSLVGPPVFAWSVEHGGWPAVLPATLAFAAVGGGLLAVALLPRLRAAG